MDRIGCGERINSARYPWFQIEKTTILSGTDSSETVSRIRTGFREKQNFGLEMEMNKVVNAVLNPPGVEKMKASNFAATLVHGR